MDSKEDTQAEAGTLMLRILVRWEKLKTQDNPEEAKKHRGSLKAKKHRVVQEAKETQAKEAQGSRRGLPVQ